MLRKNQQILILLAGLLYVYSVCPLLCATLEQKSCHSIPQKFLIGDTEVRSTCCQSAKTDGAGDAKVPSRGGESCCSKGLELVLPDDKYSTHELRESLERSLVSILPISVTFPVDSWESFEDVRVPSVSAFFPDHSLSRRGPPVAYC